MSTSTPTPELSAPSSPWLRRRPGPLEVVAGLTCWGLVLGMFALRVEYDVQSFEFLGQIPNLGRALLIALLTGALCSGIFLFQLYKTVMDKAIGVHERHLAVDTAVAAIGFVALLLVMRI